MNSFDDKLYDLIKNNSGGDDEVTITVGMRIKTNKDPPTTGTWKLVGIYGTYTYSDSVTHWMDFIGTTVLDSARGSSLLQAGTNATWNYDSILGSGNYTITSLFGSYLNSEPTQTTYNIYGSINNGTTTYSITLENNSISLSPGTGSSGGVSGQARIVITDLSKVSVSDDGLVYEYERTA